MLNDFIVWIVPAPRKRCIFLPCEICVKYYIIRLTNYDYSCIIYVKEAVNLKKSVYSLVLMDEVIKAVDEQAYRLGTSRSNLIM